MTSLLRSSLRLLALASLVSIAGCAANALTLATQAEQTHNYDLAVAEFTKALREHPNNREAQLGLQRAKLRASESHLVTGRRLYAQGKFDEALLELQLSAELNPSNADAAHEVETVRKALRMKLSMPEGGQTQLESLLQRSRDFVAPGAELPNVTLGTITTVRLLTNRDQYLTIAAVGKISVTFDSSFREVPAQASLLANMTLRQALDAVARATGTFYQVTGSSSIVVVPDTPAKRREYTQEEMRTFYVRNADLKETIDALRVVGDLRQMSPITGTNAILVRDTPERLAAIGRFITTFDKARPELVVDVEILEVDRTKLLEYGLQIASPGSPGIDGAADVNRQGLTLQSLRNLSASDVIVTGVPALYYRLLKSDSNTRTLANPHIRMTDGTKALANFGEDVPVPRDDDRADRPDRPEHPAADDVQLQDHRREHRDDAAHAFERRHHDRAEHPAQQPDRRLRVRRTADIRHPQRADDDSTQGRRNEHARGPHPRRRALREGRDSRPERHPGLEPHLHARPQGSHADGRRPHADAAHHPRPGPDG